jgi:hypothetical protein
MKKMGLQARAKERREMAYSLRQEGKTYREIGEVLGVSHGRAAQLVKRVERAKAWTESSHPRHWTGGLSVRTANGLWNNGCETVEDAARLTDKELLDIPNFGVRSLVELRLWLAGERLDDEALQAAIDKKLAEMRVERARASLQRAAEKLERLNCQREPA